MSGINDGSRQSTSNVGQLDAMLFRLGPMLTTSAYLRGVCSTDSFRLVCPVLRIASSENVDLATTEIVEAGRCTFVVYCLVTTRIFHAHTTTSTL